MATVIQFPSGGATAHSEEKFSHEELRAMSEDIEREIIDALCARDVISCGAALLATLRVAGVLIAQAENKGQFEQCMRYAHDVLERRAHESYEESVCPPPSPGVQ